MPSPFPGMNPYLEQDDVWNDLHHRLMPQVAATLVAQVRPAYIVRLEEHLFIHELPAEDRRFFGRSDVSVARARPGPAGTVASAGATTQAPAYARVLPAVDVERLSYIEVRDRGSRELITVIELLSPSNKRPGPDREQYVAKRRQLFAGSAHFVEIDLLRGGPRQPLEDLPDCDYYALVSRVEERPRVGVWPIRLRDPLPTVPVPLRAPDADARLDLQQVLHSVYDAAGYGDYIYSGKPQPPLHPQDAAWAHELIGSMT